MMHVPRTMLAAAIDRFGGPEAITGHALPVPPQITLVIMGLTTTLIGLLPTHSQIGNWAPVLLLGLRLIQGFGAGAEFAGAAILAVEFSPADRRGFYGSWSQIGVAIGLAAAVGVFWLARQLPQTKFMSWGWRIPFLMSAIVLLVGIWIRLRIGESPVFEQIQAEKKVARSPLTKVLRTQLKSLLLVLGMRFADNAILYIPMVFTLSYLKLHTKLNGNVGLVAVFLAAAAQVIFIPLFGKLSDHVGRRIVYGGGAFAAIVVMIPYFWLIDSGNVWAVYLAIALLGGVIYAALAGSQPALLLRAIPGSSALHRGRRRTRVRGDRRGLNPSDRSGVERGLFHCDADRGADHGDLSRDRRCGGIGAGNARTRSVRPAPSVRG